MADLAKKIVAVELGVSERTVDRLRKQGELRWHQVGSKVLIPEVAIAAFRQRQADKAEALQRLRDDEDFVDSLAAVEDDDLLEL